MGSSGTHTDIQAALENQPFCCLWKQTPILLHEDNLQSQGTTILYYQLLYVRKAIAFIEI